MAVVAVVYAFELDAVRAAYAVAGLVAVTWGLTPTLVAAVGAVALGEYAIAGAAALGVTASLVSRAGAVRAQATIDADALGAIFGELPGSLHAELRGLAGSAPITTTHMVSLAHGHNPAAWSQATRSKPVGGYDGVLVQDPRGGECSQFAAEAVGVGLSLATSIGRELDFDVLAVAAAHVPLSAAEEWCDGQVGETVLHVGHGQIMDAAMEFAKRPGGGHMIERVAKVVSLPDRLVTELSREQRLQLIGGGWVLRLRALVGGSTAMVLVVGIWGEIREFFRALVTTPAASEPVPVPRPEPRPEPTLDELEPAAEPGTRRRRLRPRSWFAPWSGLPPAARVAWLARPLLTVVALPVAVLVDGAAWWEVGVVAAAACVRGLRHPLVALVAAAAATALAPAAGALLLVRLAVGEAVLFGIGAGRPSARRRAGWERIVQARRHLTDAADLGAESVEEATEGMRSVSVTADDDAALERVAVLVGAAWAEARPMVLVRALRLAVRGALSGQWGEEGHASFEGEFRRLFMMEVAGDALARAAACIAAAGVAAAVFADVTGPFGDGELAGRVTAAAAALVVAVPLSARERRFFSAALVAAIVWLVVGADGAGPLVTGIGAAVLARAARRVTARSLLAGPDSDPHWPPPPGMPRPLRRHWEAAERASHEGRRGLAIELLETLAGDPRARDFESACQGRIALLHLEAGRVDAAATALDQLPEEEPAGAAALAAGTLSAALGDDAAGERHLTRAVATLGERGPLASRARIELAAVRARLGDVAGADEVIRTMRSRTLARRGMAAMIETEVILAAALARGGDRAGARARLDEIEIFDEDDPALREYGRDVVDAFMRAQGLANLLRGRLHLEAGEPVQAEKRLGRAAAALGRPADAGLRATAQVLQGVALARRVSYEKAVEVIRAGLAALEGRRTQLRAGDRRTAMITADEEVYRWALDALTRADRAGIRGAGLVAGTLVESLRKSAISARLRAGPLPPSSKARSLGQELALLEHAGGAEEDVARVRDALGDAYSDEFAAAYLPTPVEPDDLLRAARRHGHVLAFHIPPSGLPGWRVWVAPDGRARVDDIGSVGRSTGHPLHDLARTGAFDGELIYAPWEECEDRWRSLAEELLPEELRSELEAAAAADPPTPILVVPDGILASVPWAGLSVGGRPLVERAAVQLVPTIDLAGAVAPRPSANGGYVLAHRERSQRNGALDVLAERLRVREAKTREAFVEALESREHDGVYVLTHGNEMGLDQRIEFEGSAVLSAAAALSHPWPDWVVFAACLVGRVNPRAGQEPLGLAISCMLGGSSTIVASVVKLTQVSAPRACAELAASLARGEAPAAALRAVQLAHLERDPLVSLADCLGLVCISTRALEL